MDRLFRQKEEQKSLWQRIKDVALADVNVVVRGLDEDAIQRVEELLLASDFGVPATLRIVDHIERLLQRGKVKTERDLKEALEEEIAGILSAGEAGTALRGADRGPTVILVVGVNGVGKTTSIGKLAHLLRKQGRKVLLAAGDTYRAGAIEQLRLWAERTGSQFVGATPGADPAAVAFDAVAAAESRDIDIVLIDTAGRLHTQDDLMAELQKVARVVARKREGAPHEVLLVLDATIGQNAVAQLRTFSRDLPITGLVLAKLDSTAKGGVVVALKEEFGIPVKLIGTGEGLDRLEAFDPERFAAAVLEE